jgi:hypothetical protein
MNETAGAPTPGGAGPTVAATPAPRGARARRERKTKLPADFGPIQVLRHAGLAEWQWDAAAAAGLIPRPDMVGRWSAAVADGIAARRAEHRPP